MNEPLEIRAIRDHNCGYTPDEAARLWGEEIRPHMEALLKKYGDNSAPHPDDRWRGRSEISDRVRRRHLGLEGPGAVLKEIIRRERMKEGSQPGVPESEDTAVP